MAVEPRGARDAGQVPPRKKRSFLRRSLRYLALLALLLAVALVVGFRLEANKWAFEDLQGFRAYAGEWWALVKQKTSEGLSFAKRKSDEYGITEATRELIARARRALEAEPEQPASAGTPQARAGAGSASPGAARAEGPAGTGASVPAPGVPAAYYAEYKAGYEAYRDGLRHFKESISGPRAQKELRAAKACFEKARDHFQKALSIYDKDSRADSLLTEVSRYLYDCNKRLKPTY